MSFSPRRSGLFFWLLLLPLASPIGAMAQDDNTGTNPVNFTYDFRLITEMQWLPDDGGSLLKHTAEFRWPMGGDVANLRGEAAGPLADMGSRFGLRFRGYYNHLSVNDPDAGSFGSSSVSGIGDLDVRLLGIAHASSKFILAPGIEAIFNTASNDALGSGKTALAPVVFGVFPGLVGGSSLFAPGYQYVFDVAGDSDRGDISRSQIDLYFVWILSGGRNWFLLDPQIIVDHENSVEFMTVDAEWGFMIAPQSGLSGYVRPGVGIGEHRPFDWNFEFAVKFIWR